jgi:hypothetical protein
MLRRSHSQGYQLRKREGEGVRVVGVRRKEDGRGSDLCADDAVSCKARVSGMTEYGREGEGRTETSKGRPHVPAGIDISLEVDVQDAGLSFLLRHLRPFLMAGG